MQTIYNVPQKTYLKPFLLASVPIPFLVGSVIASWRWPSPFWVLFIIFLIIMTGFSWVFGLDFLLRLQKTQIVLTAEKITIVIPSLPEISLLWEDIMAYRRYGDQCILFTAERAYILPLDRFDNPSLVEDIEMRLSPSSLTQEALESVYPQATLYRKLATSTGYQQTVSVSWLYRMGELTMLLLFVSSIGLFTWVILPESLFFVVIILLFGITITIWILFVPRQLMFDDRGITVSYIYRQARQMAWTDIKFIRESASPRDTLTLIGTHQKLSIPNIEHWKIDQIEAAEALVTYIEAQLWERGIRVKRNEAGTFASAR